MKRILILLMILTLTGALAACRKEETLALSGTVESTQIDVCAETGGKILQLLVDEGSVVKKDDVIATIDAAAAQIQVENAAAAVKNAKAKLDELKSGSRPEQIAQAEAAVKTAKAKLDEQKSGSRPEQIAQTEAAVKNAKARLDELKAGSRPEQIAQAEAAYQQAQSGVSSAQDQYDYRLVNLNRFKELFLTNSVSKSQLDDAQFAFDQAENQLNIAKQQQQSAQAQLELVKNGSTQQTITAAEGNYEQALAQYELAVSGASKESIEAAEGAYEQAVAQLELLKKGSTKQAIQSAEANVEQLQATMDSAALQVEKCVIRAPIDGVVLTKPADVGQVVSAGANIATIQQNYDYWIKIYIPQDYNAKVKLNQQVKIKTTALPGETISGTVVFKSPKAEFTPKNIQTTEAKEKDTVLAVKIHIDDHAEEISAGMIANVELE